MISLLLGIHNSNNLFNEEKDNNISDLINADKISELTSCSGGKRLQQLKEMVDFEDGGIISEDGNIIYYLGIIDILTDYGFAKQMEHFVKMMRYCSNKMSCIPPDLYSERFYKYMKNTVFRENEDQKSEESTKRALLPQNKKNSELNNNEVANDNIENENVEQNEDKIEDRSSSNKKINELDDNNNIKKDEN